MTKDEVSKKMIMFHDLLMEVIKTSDLKKSQIASVLLSTGIYIANNECNDLTKVYIFTDYIIGKTFDDLIERKKSEEK